MAIEDHPFCHSEERSDEESGGVRKERSFAALRMTIGGAGKGYLRRLISRARFRRLPVPVFS